MDTFIVATLALIYAVGNFVCGYLNRQQAYAVRGGVWLLWAINHIVFAIFDLPVLERWQRTMFSFFLIFAFEGVPLFMLIKPRLAARWRLKERWLASPLNALAHRMSQWKIW